MPRHLFPSSPRIGVVELRGLIVGGPRPAVYTDLLYRLAEAPSVRSVLLDIDSPGGSAVASDALRLAVARVRERKPVVAYVRGLGASGAYLVACAATRVLALPTALVGSIGVISVRAHLRQLLERAGVALSVSKAGRLKDLGAFWRDETPEEEAVEQALVDEYYEHFVQTVASARGFSLEGARGLATGEVYTGRRALEMGLIDGVGDWEDAVRAAMDLGAAPRRLVHARPRRGLAQLLFAGAGGPGGLGVPRGLATLLGARVLYLDARSLAEYL